MKVRYTRRALQQLDSILDYIAQDRPSAARRQIDRIRHAIELLGQFPRMGHAGSSDGTLELVAPGTPFIVVYRIANDEVQILAVFHGRQKRPEG